MSRRSILKYMGAAGAAGVVGGGFWLGRDRHHPELELSEIMHRLDAMDAASVVATGDWEAARLFDHLAQSIEFSMDGFPTHKSAVFKHTVGRLAFAVFQANGRMTHALNEAIPGELVIATPADTKSALNRLRTAVDRFEAHRGELQPHFAYGQLDKAEYGLAHAMHINDHLDEIVTT